jgi:hypothetical protein
MSVLLIIFSYTKYIIFSIFLKIWYNVDMKKFTKKKLIFGLLFVVSIVPAVFIGVDYYQWLGVKKAVALGGYTNNFGGTFGAIQPGCVYTQGGCSCALCNDCGCVGYNQATIGVTQSVNMGMPNLCVHSSLVVKGTPIQAASGLGFIGGSFTGKCMAGTATLGTASYAVNNIEKMKKFIGDFYIATFK